MPRGRMLNKRISLDEVVAQLSLKSTIFFTFCIPHLDIGGKILGDLNYLKGTVLPFRKDFSVKAVATCIKEVSDSGLIIVYGDDGKYLKFKGFEKNQTLNPDKEAESEIPNPTPEELLSNSRVTPGKVKLKINSKLNSKSKSEKTIHPLQSWISEELKNVSKLEQQLTTEECERLLGEYDGKLIKEVLEAMENKKDLIKKYKSVNLTLRNWIKIRLERNNGSPGTYRKPYRKGDHDADKFARELKTEKTAS